LSAVAEAFKFQSSWNLQIDASALYILARAPETPWKAEKRPQGRTFGRYGSAIQGFLPVSGSRNAASGNLSRAGTRFAVGDAVETNDMASAGAVRQREWRRRRRANRRQRCGCCEAIFTPARADQAFCSSVCRQRGYRRRKASGEPASPRPREAPWLASAPLRPPNAGAMADARPGPALRTASGKAIDVASLIG
jgi:hypothetical protein